MVIGIAVVAFLGVLLFGLATGRIDWRGSKAAAPPTPRKTPA